MDKLFANKRKYITENGDEILDMVIPSLNLSKLKSNAVMRLNQSHKGRLDKFVYECVSKDLDEGLDLVMYYNHIFNPFAVDEGDYLFTPVSGGDYYNSNQEPDLPDGTKKSDMDVVTNQMTYAQKVEYFAKLGLGIA